jgi:hypothetical protein
MKLTNIKEGIFLKIKNKKYEVVKIQRDIDYISETEEVKGVLEINLRESNSKSLFPTHLIKFYFYSENAYLFDNVADKKPPKGFEYLRKINSFSLKNKRKLNKSEIHILK